jgi:predicted oxidoreductase (fatty acid repression mutant protein)
MTNKTIETLKTRRSIYAIGKNSPLSSGEIDTLVRDALRLTPSSFNSQSSRAVILFGESNAKFWSITLEALRAVAPAEGFAATEAKIASFAAGVGTVLFYEDNAAIEALQQAYALYAPAFPGFAEHSNGMAQLSVWNALANAGLGATLQHYSNLIEAPVAAAFGLSEKWSLKAQMPFGSIEAPAKDKTFIADEGRFLTFS